MDADRDRTLRIEIPPCDVNKSPEEPEWTGLEGLNGWQLTIPGTPIIHWEGTIDLSGYARDYKTFYPAGGVIQRGAYMSMLGGSGSVTYTVISSTPLNPAEVYYQVGSVSGPGFLNLNTTSAVGLGLSQQDWNQILFAESEVNVPNVNITPNVRGVQQPLERNQSGSLSPTAAQVLYCIKMVFPLDQNGVTRMTIPASRVILPGTMDQEPELEYMMRLSRSIELANQV
jgi:hypothetical protein